MAEAAGLYERAVAAAEFVHTQTSIRPVLGIILGSGLGSFAGRVQNATTIPYSEIPHFPVSTVVGHSGKLVLGTIAGVPVAVMQGRVHAYEGYALSEVTLPARVLGLIGCATLIVTNAAGGLQPDIPGGSLVTITDHINLTGTNAALGPNEPRFGRSPQSGQRFFDMSGAYSPRLRAIAHAEAERQGILLGDGVYLAVLGPSFETPAEIRAFRTLGADLVGMSTVHEVIVARHMGIELLGISLVTNLAAGVAPPGKAAETIAHEDVMEMGRRVDAKFTALLVGIIPQIVPQP
jgi:purine-nucleoside phosphorylase